MTTEEKTKLIEQANQLIKGGASESVVAALFTANNIRTDVAASVARQLISEAAAPAAPEPVAAAPLTPTPKSISELERLVRRYTRLCKQVYDPDEVDISPEEWARNIARSALRLLRDKDDEATLKIGTKVREIELDENMELVLDENGAKKYVDGYYLEGTATFVKSPGRYGIVVGNIATIEADLKPFEDYEHNLNDLRDKPAVSDDELAGDCANHVELPQPIDGYEEVDDLYTHPATFEPTHEFDPTFIEFLATLVTVRWFSKSGVELEVREDPEIALEVIQ